MLRKWDIDNNDLNKKCIDEVIARIQDIDDPEQAGVIVAQDLIDIVMENYAPHIYNRGVASALRVVSEKTQDLEFELEELKER